MYRLLHHGPEKRDVITARAHALLRDAALALEPHKGVDIAAITAIQLESIIITMSLLYILVALTD